MWKDILAPDLDVIFVGFNPSMEAWRTGFHYAKAGNRFYLLLEQSGLTPRKLLPSECRTLPSFGIGLADLVHRATARADQVPRAEYLRAVPKLLSRLEEAAPRAVCFNGIGLFEMVFGRRPALGLDPTAMIGKSRVYAAPSSSGLANGMSAERLAVYRAVAESRQRRRRT
jgi:double-stranded uracil-DNA glycosylase